MTTENQPIPRWTGGCHCGALRFEVHAILTGPDAHDVVHCNCSICTLKGFLHLIVEAPSFRILEGEQDLSLYTFGTHQAKHKFCKKCGVHPFYIPRSHPQGTSVNVHALDVVKSLELRVCDLNVVPFDGQNWEENVKSIQ